MRDQLLGVAPLTGYADDEVIGLCRVSCYAEWWLGSPVVAGVGY
jgi:hypothetical protein